MRPCRRHPDRAALSPAHAQEAASATLLRGRAARADIDAAGARALSRRYQEVAARARPLDGWLERRTATFELRRAQVQRGGGPRGTGRRLVRTKGEQGSPRPCREARPSGEPARQKPRNARDLLQQELVCASGDPVIATLLGEAHLALGDVEFAGMVLEDLAEADLIVSPEGWAALAKARAAAGQTEQANAARKRCEDAARDVTVCSGNAALARS